MTALSPRLGQATADTGLHKENWYDWSTQTGGEERIRRQGRTTVSSLSGPAALNEETPLMDQVFCRESQRLWGSGVFSDPGAPRQGGAATPA